MGRSDRGDQDRGRFGGEKPSRGAAGSKPRSSPGQNALKEAEVLQQRAERKRGLDAVPVYEQAAAKYREALQQQLTAEDMSASHFGLGESLHQAASSLLAGSCSAREGRLAEDRTRQAAVQLLGQAVEEYHQVADQDGKLRVDALVNSGNTLAAWAELENPSNALQLLQQAAEAYRTALSEEEDALTCSNLGDALVSAAELLQRDSLDRSRQVFGEAMTAYSTACSLSSSEKGDDLPSLLYNWGVGLFSAHTHLKDGSALEEAIAKLKASISFARGDAMAFNALGDALAAQAEAAPDSGKQEALLQQALQEGYSMALNINRQHSDALVGTAEVELQRGRSRSGAEALAQFRLSMEAYAAALQHPGQLGSFQEWCDVQYNYACAASLAGEPQRASTVLQKLLDQSGVAAEDVLQDPDFQALKGTAWYQELQKGLGQS